MYLYDSPPSEAHRPTIVSLGELGRTLKRKAVRDTTTTPYRWICAIDAQFPPSQRMLPSAQGTGFLISPRHVLTSASNVVRIQPPFKESHPKNGIRIDAQKVTVTPALDGRPGLGRKRAPVGSIELQAPAWWIPDQYFTDLSLKWDIALLTLPQELPSLRGMPYGYWGDTRFAPRTTIRASTNESLSGKTLTTSGYTDGRCFDEVPPPTASNPYPQTTDPYSIGKRGTSLQWETFGRVQPGHPGPAEWGILWYDSASCYGMEGAPVWANTGDLQLVAIHGGPNFRNQMNLQIPPQLDLALALRTEILDLLRGRVSLAGLRPSF
jgi:hypothetical protein